jgi:CDP-6-deoxy-D-xylo-4-hexulose-3-dehydrase
MNQAELLKKEILDKVLEYYRIKHKKDSSENFVAGKSRINYAGRYFDENELINLVDSSLEFWLTYGRYSRQFEKRLAEFLGLRWVLLVNSGSSANLLAFSALTSPLLKKRQVKRGDEVITAAAGFPTTIAPIVQLGAIPVFIDVKLETGNIDTALLENALTSKTKAIMVAHTLGNPFELRAVKEFCDKHELWLIEDNCDALGSKYEGKYTGTWGDIGTSSFYPPHHITMGEGGAVYTDDPMLKKIMLSIRDWGRDCCCESGFDNICGKRFDQQHGTLPFGYDHKYVYSHFGYNLKVSDMQAAVGLAQLEKLENFTERRKNNFAILNEALQPVSDKILLPKTTPGSEPSWFCYLMVLRDNCGFNRNDIVRYLEKNNIQTRTFFAGNLVRHPCFDTLVKGSDYRISGTLDNTDKIMNHGFLVGVYPGMTEDKLRYMADSIIAFITKKSAE